MKKYITACFALFFCIPSFAATLSVCSQTTQQIYQYNKNLPTSASNVFPYSWQDMSWLQQTLGLPTDTKRFVEKKLIWAKYSYSVVTKNESVISSEGVKPAEIANVNGTPSAPQLITLLGQPDKTEENQLTQYTWACADTGSSLTVTSHDDQDHQDQSIRSYQGTYCPEANTKNNCMNFSNFKLSLPSYKNIGVGLQKADLYVQHPPLHPQLTHLQAIKEAQKQTVLLIKNQIDPHAKSFAQVATIAKQTIENYYVKLSQCTPGTYYYVFPFLLGGNLVTPTEVAPFFYVAKSTIQGIREDKCVVETKIMVGKNNGLQVCQFSTKNLSLFTPEQALIDSVALNQLDNNQIIQAKMLLKECQAYMNGELLSLD